MSTLQLLRDGHQGLARAACLLGGVVWGVYWIPLRAIDAVGISGAWATAVFHIVPAMLLLPLVWHRRAQLQTGGASLQAVGASLGLAMMLYSTAFLYTDVVHAVLLYYLTPIWSTLLARAWLKEQITRDRVVGIVLGLSGMLVILNIEQGFPWPRNIGDWMALGSGIVWAIAANLMRRYPEHSVPEVASMWFLWCSALAVIAALSLQGTTALPPPGILVSILPWLLPTVLLLVLPGYLAITWGTPQLNPGTVGLLFMTEISVGAVSAALLTEEAFGIREITGIVLISLAGLAEVLLPAARRLGRSFSSDN